MYDLSKKYRGNVRVVFIRYLRNFGAVDCWENSNKDSNKETIDDKLGRYFQRDTINLVLKFHVRNPPITGVIEVEVEARYSVQFTKNVRRSALYQA